MKGKRRPSSSYNFWQPATDMMSGLVFVLILVIALLCLYILHDYTGYEEYPASSASSYDDDGWGAGWGDWDDDWDGGWGGGDDDSSSSEYREVTAGGGGHPDEGIKSAVFVEMVDDETNRPIPEEGIRFELYRTDNTQLQDGSLQQLNTYYPEKITFREYATREDGTFYLPEKIWPGNYYFHELNVPEGYDPAADTYFDITQLYDWPDPYVVQVRLSPCKNIIRVQLNDADTELPVGEGSFRVVAAEDITTMDGTVRYTAGEVVDTIQCDEEGYGESIELYLGAYTLQQATSPNYYATMEEDLEVEVEKKTGVLPEIHEIALEKTQIVVTLADELYTDQMLEGAVFTATNSRTGESRTAATDATGTAVFTDLDKGASYRITQTQAVGDYRPDANTHTLVVTADGRIEGDSSANVLLTNRLLRVSIHAIDMVLRSDTIDEQMALYTSGGQLIQSWQTNGVGLLLTDLPEGDYYIVHGGSEEEEGDRYDFTVVDTAEVQNWSISVFTLRSVLALVVAALIGAGVIALIVLVVRLLSGRRKAKRGPVTVASNTDADTKAEPNKK